MLLGLLLNGSGFVIKEIIESHKVLRAAITEIFHAAGQFGIACSDPDARHLGLKEEGPTERK